MAHLLIDTDILIDVTNSNETAKQRLAAESQNYQQFQIPDYGHSKPLISRLEQIMVEPQTR